MSLAKVVADILKKPEDWDNDLVAAAVTSAGLIELAGAVREHTDRMAKPLEDIAFAAVRATRKGKTLAQAIEDDETDGEEIKTGQEHGAPAPG